MRYTNYLRWGAVAAIFAALFVPFIVATGSWGVPNLFFPYITGKNFAFRFLVEFALLCYLLLAFAFPKYRPRASNIMWAVFAFVVLMGVATVLSVDPSKSFWSNFERMEGYLGLLHLFAWFIVAGALLGAENLWERFLSQLVCCRERRAGPLGAVAIFGLVHHIEPERRARRHHLWQRDLHGRVSAHQPLSRALPARAHQRQT